MHEQYNLYFPLGMFSMQKLRKGITIPLKSSFGILLHIYYQKIRNSYSLTHVITKTIPKSHLWLQLTNISLINFYYTMEINLHFFFSNV